MDQIDTQLSLKHYDTAICHMQHHVSLSPDMQPELNSLLIKTQRDRADDAVQYKQFICRVVADISLLKELRECTNQYHDSTQRFLESTTFPIFLCEIANSVPENVSKVLKILIDSPDRSSIFLLALKARNQLTFNVYLELGGFICHALEKSNLTDKEKREIAVEYGEAIGSSISHHRNASHFTSLRESITSKLAHHVLEGSVKSKCFTEILVEVSRMSCATSETGQLYPIGPTAFTIFTSLLQSTDHYTLAQQEVVTFVRRRLSEGQPEGMCDAINLVSAVFLIDIETGLLVLRLEGFLEEIWAESEEFEQMLVPVLEMLSTACMSKEAREIINSRCFEMLQSYLQADSTDGTVYALATTILCKIGGINSGWDVKAKQEAVSILVSSARHTKQLNSILEALMFLSTDTLLKDSIAGQMCTIHRSITLLSSSDFSKMAYTLSVLIHNLIDVAHEVEDAITSKQILTATGAKVNTDKNALERLNVLLDGDLIKVLSLLFRSKSKAVRRNVADIMYWMSHLPSARSTLTAMGAIRYLCSFLQVATNDLSPLEKQRVSQSLAKILISVDPNLAFNSSASSATDVIVPLSDLLGHSKNDSLSIFEATLSLTNLSTLGEMECMIIIRAWDDILDNLHSDFLLVRRATTELICNLVVSDVGATRFLCPEPTGTQNLNNFMNLMTCNDFDTRRAACGTVAVLSYHEETCKLLKDNFGIMDSILYLLEESSVEITKRALVMLKNLIGRAMTFDDVTLGRLRVIVTHHASNTKVPEAETILQYLKEIQPNKSTCGIVPEHDFVDSPTCVATADASRSGDCRIRADARDCAE